MPTLVLIRHGESGFAARDHVRPLTPRGKEKAASRARATARIVGDIDAAIVSGATRTQQTLVTLRSTGLAIAKVWEEANLHSRGGEGLFETLHDLGRCGVEDSARESAGTEDGVEVEAVLVVGHEPTMSTLTGLLATRENDLPESRGRTPFRALGGSGATRANSLRHGLSTAIAVVGHVESWSSLASSCMRTVDVLHP